MSVRTHTASWRPLLAIAPLLGAAAIVMIAIQGEPEVALSRNVHFVLLPVSLAGWWVAWRLARVLTDTPVTPVALARAGYVALRGKAQSMPNEPPLTTPSGTPCVWYRHSSHSGTNHPGGYSASDTVQPFLLVDDSGQCIVLPKGADITGGASTTALGGTERLIAPGDTIYVAGEFRPASAETLQHIRDVGPELEHVSVSYSVDDTVDPSAAKERGAQLLKAAREANAAAASARAANRLSLQPLPVVCDPANHSPFVISANKDGSSEASWYGLLAAGNLIVVVASGALLSYVLWLAR